MGKNKKNKNKESKNAFTLIELMAVIVIITVLFGISALAVSGIVRRVKLRAHFTSVANIVDSILIENLGDKEYYLYDYSKSKNSDNAGANISELFVIAYKDETTKEIKKAVYSTMGDEIIIDVADYNKNLIDKINEWDQKKDFSDVVVSYGSTTFESDLLDAVQPTGNAATDLAQEISNNASEWTQVTLDGGSN